MRIFKSIIVTVLLGLIAVGMTITSAQSAPVFVNGSFETDDWISRNFSTIPSGWTGAAYGSFPFGTDNLSGGAGAGTADETPFGQQFMVIGSRDSGGNDFISQTLSGFSIGTSYELQFYMSPEVNSSTSFGHTIDVTITGAASTTTNFVIGSGAGTGAWNQWFLQRLLFTADAVSLAFRFDGATGDGIAYCGYAACIEAGLDNISLTEISAVPLPPSAILFGTALLGMAGLRRRKRKVA